MSTTASAGHADPYPPPKPPCIVLMLQGGGAPGTWQVGVCQALQEAERGREASKVFFSEEKKQKTFIRSGRRLSGKAGTRI